MHPEQTTHESSRDPILDGRDSLRLVKLRLALTLIAGALLVGTVLYGILRVYA